MWPTQRQKGGKIDPEISSTQCKLLKKMVESRAADFSFFFWLSRSLSILVTLQALSIVFLAIGHFETELWELELCWETEL